MNRLDFYETYFKNVSPTTFNVYQKDGKIIIEDIDKPYPKGFNSKDVKQYPLLKETYMKTNDKGKLISKRIAKGEYEITYKGKKFDLIDVKGEVEGTLHWHIGEKEEGETWFSKRGEDALWYTKAEAMDMIEHIVDKDEKGEYDYLNDPEYFKKGGKVTWKKNIGEDGWSSTMENESAYDNEGGYISESGNWKIYREGRWYIRQDDGLENFKRDGIWIVKGKNEYGRIEETYGYFESLKEAKQYVENWIQINPQDFKKGGKVTTWKNKYNKKYGYEKNESHSLKEISKDTGVSKKGLQQIYNKGVGAYKTNPSSVRPNVKSKEQWAMARVYSAVMGGKASKIDSKELKMEFGGDIPKDKVYFVGGKISKLREMHKLQRSGSMDEKVQYLKDNPQWFMGKVYDKGGVIGEEVTLNTYNFSGYDYREFINAQAGVSFLLTGEYELVSKYLYENDYAMWLFYNYLNRINISEADMKAWVKQAYESFGKEQMPVPVAVRNTPDAKDGRSFAMWYATTNPRDLTLIDISEDTKPFFYNGQYWINEIGMVANYDSKKWEGWGAKFTERKTGLLIPYYEGKSFHFNTLIHEFCHCLDFQTQLVKNIKEKEERDKDNFKEEIVDTYGYRIDDNGIVIYDDSLSQEEKDKIALEIQLYGNLENKSRNQVTAPITNHLKEFCETLVRMLRHLADGNVPLTQIFEQEAIDTQIILQGVYGDELLEQRKRKKERARVQKKADEIRDNKRFSWQDSLNTELKKYFGNNSNDKSIANILGKKKNANLRLHQILEIDNLINKYISKEYKQLEIYNPKKAKAMIPVINQHKREANRIINNHYDNIRNDYDYGFKPDEDKIDMVLYQSCPFSEFDFYKDWKNCNKLKLEEYYETKKEA